MSRIQVENSRQYSKSRAQVISTSWKSMSRVFIKSSSHESKPRVQVNNPCREFKSKIKKNSSPASKSRVQVTSLSQESKARWSKSRKCMTRVQVKGVQVKNPCWEFNSWLQFMSFFLTWSLNQESNSKLKIQVNSEYPECKSRAKLESQSQNSTSKWTQR